jgi:rubrerythrin
VAGSGYATNKTALHDAAQPLPLATASLFRVVRHNLTGHNKLMHDTAPHERGLPDLGPDKALAIGSYGETVAAYRYLVFAERARSRAQRDAFAAMADEEQDHKQRLLRLLARHYPGSAFVLSDDDKNMVVVGPRLVDVRDDDAFARALRMTLQSEQRTAAFYDRLSQCTNQNELRDLFQELAEEGVEHFQRLRELVRDSGIDPDVEPAE